MHLSIIEFVFRDKRQYRLFLALAMSTIFSFLLIGGRLWKAPFDWSAIHSWSDLKNYRGVDATYLFLVWNLFLAWIPYWLSVSLNLLDRLIVPSRVSVGILLGSWLVFFPNAPYIVTDLLHLRPHTNVPFWYDVILFLSFAQTGLLLGYSSLFEIEHFVGRRFSQAITRGATVGALALCGFGIFMGRFQRWNSWDVLHRPLAIARSEWHIAVNPMAYLGSIAVAVVISAFLMMGYWTFSALKMAGRPSGEGF